jgi:hypothetical protein
VDDASWLELPVRASQVFLPPRYRHASPEVIGDYSNMVSKLVSRFYSAVTRYATSSF